MKVKVAIASIIIFLALSCLLKMGPAFADRVPESPACQKNPDSWWCQMWSGR